MIFPSLIVIVALPREIRSSLGVIVATSLEIEDLPSFLQCRLPRCDHCGCKIVGHGIESNGSFYCCANCAREKGERGARDRVA
jgi:hypothetical protein